MSRRDRVPISLATGDDGDSGRATRKYEYHSQDTVQLAIINGIYHDKLPDFIRQHFKRMHPSFSVIQ